MMMWGVVLPSLATEEPRQASLYPWTFEQILKLQSIELLMLH